MKRMSLGWILAGFLSLALGAFAQEVQLDPLLQLLVENKVITVDQAVSVQKEYDRRRASQQPPSAVVPPPAQPAPAPAAATVTPAGAVTPAEAQKIAEEVVAKAKPNLGDFKGWKLGGTLFLSYQNGEKYSPTTYYGEGKIDTYNKFLVKRAYIDIRKEITPWLSARVTPDITQDSTGDYKLRLKFAYAQFNWKGNTLFGKPYLKAGMVPTPWDEFDSSVNRYRMQDTMFADRVLGTPTADLGLTAGGIFGSEMSKSYQAEVSEAFPGRFGSWSVGVYNGAGYSGVERDRNKTLQARVTLRPLPGLLPGLQLSAGGTWGTRTVATFYIADPYSSSELRINADWTLYQAMLSYQHRRFTLSAQYLKGIEDEAGFGNSPYNFFVFPRREIAGHSLFGEYRLPATNRFSVFYRHDHFNPDLKRIQYFWDIREAQKRDILGFAWWMHNENALLIDYDLLGHSRYELTGRKVPDEGRFQVTLQLKF